jgi:phosphatidylglycerophosphatase A
MPPKDEGGDPGWFVLDETAGVWLAAALVGPTWTSIGLAFLLFRIFDIWKPPPVRTLERVGGGWGIVLDDLAAGVYALLLLFAWETWGAS